MKHNPRLPALILTHAIVFGVGMLVSWLLIDRTKNDEEARVDSATGAEVRLNKTTNFTDNKVVGSNRVGSARSFESDGPGERSEEGIEESPKAEYSHISEIFSADIPNYQLIDEVVEYVARQMGKVSWEKVADEVLELPGGPARAYALLEVVDGAPESEQVALINQLLPRLDGLEYRSVASAIATKWSDTNPNAAFEYGMGLDDGEVRDFLIQIGASEMARLAPDVAAQTIESHEESLGIEYPVIVNEVASTWAENNPTAALQWYAEAAGDWSQVTRDEGYFNLLTTYAQQSPEQALGKLGVVESESLRSEIQETIYRLWSESDPLAAGTHLSANDYTPDMKNSVKTLALEWSDYDPLAAVDWLNSWGSVDENLKAEVIREIKRNHQLNR